MKVNQSEAEKLSALTEVELAKEEKTRKTLFFAFVVIIIIMIGTAIVNTIKSGFGIFTVMPVIFAPMALSNWVRYKAVKDEVKSRQIN